MHKESEIRLLEKHIERLLEHYTGLKARNRLLERDLREQQEENRRLQQELETLEKDRGEIGGRVSSLIEKIEAWQAGIDSETETPQPITESGGGVSTQPVGGAGSAGHETAGSDQGPEHLSSTAEGGKNTVQEPKEDKGGGVQASLFAKAPSSG